MTSSLVAALFVSLVFCIGLRFLKSPGGALLAAACASIVGGWDIIPVFIRWILGNRMVIMLDSWSPLAWRIHNLTNNFIWCPQHVFAVAALLQCVYWLQCCAAARWWPIIAPLAAISLFGTSLYQAVVIFVALGVYLLFSDRILPYARHGSWKAFSICAASGLITLLLMAPQVWHYEIMARRYPGGLTLRWERFTYAFLGRLVRPGVLANLLDAPWILLSNWACRVWRV